MALSDKQKELLLEIGWFIFAMLLGWMLITAQGCSTVRDYSQDTELQHIKDSLSNKVKDKVGGYSLYGKYGDSLAPVKIQYIEKSIPDSMKLVNKKEYFEMLDACDVVASELDRILKQDDRYKTEMSGAMINYQEKIKALREHIRNVEKQDSIDAVNNATKTDSPKYNTNKKVWDIISIGLGIIGFVVIIFGLWALIKKFKK